MSLLLRGCGSSCSDNSYLDGITAANICPADDLDYDEIKATNVSTDLTASATVDVASRTCLCRICGESFSSRAALALHLQDKHSTDDRCYKCGSCSKSFPSGQQLTQHMLVHTNVRRYQCQFCDKAFKQLSHVQQHERIHTGELPYHCPVSTCDRSFRQLSSMKQHLKGHGSVVIPFSISSASSSSPSSDHGFTAAASPKRTYERLIAAEELPSDVTSLPTYVACDMRSRVSSSSVQPTDARSSESDNSVEASSVNNEGALPVKKWRDPPGCFTPLYQRSLIDLSSKLGEIKKRQRRLRLRAAIPP